MRDEMIATLNIYKWPSQAFWRYFELQALKQIEYERPILEIGCGDGQFSSLVFREIDEAIDVNPHAVEKCRRLANRLYRRVQCLDAKLPRSPKRAATREAKPGARCRERTTS